MINQVHSLSRHQPWRKDMEFKVSLAIIFILCATPLFIALVFRMMNRNKFLKEWENDLKQERDNC